MLVFFKDLLQAIALGPFMMVFSDPFDTAFEGYPIGESCQGTFGSLDQVMPCIGSRASLVPLHHYGTAHFGFYDGGIDIPAFKIQLIPFMIRGKVLFRI